jgi:ABC-type polysaccharide/polyol phosphate transport system ATPase subunit
MSAPALRCHDLGKRYKLYQRPGQRLLDWVAPHGAPRYQDFWALRHVSFAVTPGECLGIIGPNGAGKSTLLKILAGTMTPTEGSFAAAHRVLALLELGTGLHPELTGRDNVQYVAGLLGYVPEEIAQRTPAIVEFAGLGDFIDRPVRTYSSGMFVRLAFAVYAGLEPRILIVDEALAVGDIAFQRRCLRRIEDLRSNGTAILLVTHDMVLVPQFCDRALLLHQGETRFAGAPRDAVEVLHGILFAEPAPALRAVDDSIAYGDGAAEFVDIWVEDGGGRRTETVAVGGQFTFCYRVRFRAETPEPVLGLRLATVHGIVLTSTNTQMQGRRTATAEPGDEWEVRWRLHPPLTPGHYFLSCGCSYPDRDAFLCRKVDALKLTVVGTTRASGLADVVQDVEIRTPDSGSTAARAPS